MWEFAGLLDRSLVECLGWALVHFVWQGAVLANVFLILLVSLRRRPAAARYAVSYGMLVLMTVCPAVTFAWLYRQAGYPPGTPAPSQSGTIVEAVEAPLPMTPSAVPWAEDDPAVVLPSASPENVVAADSPPGTIRDRRSDGARVAAASETTASPSPIAAAFSLAALRPAIEAAIPWLVLVWMAGVIACSLRLAMGWLQVRRLRSSGREASAAWGELVSGVARRMGLSRAVRLLESGLADVPAVIGWLRPVVLLPSIALTGLSPAQLEALLAHELAHVRRNDYLLNALQMLIETLLFYHPAVWWVSARVRKEREDCCDDWAVRVCRDPLGYARALASMAELRPAPVRLVVAARGGSLLARIRRVVGVPDRRGSHVPISLCSVVGVVFLGMAVAVPLMVSRAPGGYPAPKEPGQTPAASERTDRYGDPLPAGAAACLGTFRLRHPGGHKSLAFSADGKKLLTMADTGVRVWETATGTLLADRFRPGDTLSGVVMLNRGLHGFCVGNDGSIAGLVNRFDSQFRNPECSVVLVRAIAGRLDSPVELNEPEAAESSSLCFTPDGSRLFVGQAGGAIHVWDVARREMVAKQQLPGKSEYLSIAVSPDGKLLGAVFGDEVYAWPWSSGKEPYRLKLQRHDGRAAGVAFSSDGKRLAIGYGDPTLIPVWGLEAGGVVRNSGWVIRNYRGPSIGISDGGFALPPEGCWLAVPAIADTRVIVWDMTTGRRLRRFDTDPFEPKRVAISSDGQWLAAIPSVEARIKVWNMKTGEEVAGSLIGHDDAVTGLEYFPDGKTIVTAGDDHTVRTWDAARGVQKLVLRHDYTVRGVAVSPDGKWIASGSTDDTLRLWDAATGREVRRLAGHGTYGGHRPVAFSKDGRRLADWGDNDLKLRVWDVATGKSIHEWEVPLAYIRETQSAGVKENPDFLASAKAHRFQASGLPGTQFSPDARVLMLNMIREAWLFDVDTGKLIQMVPRGPRRQGVVRSVAMAPDGKRLSLAEYPDPPVGTPFSQSPDPGAAARVLLYELPSGKELWHQQWEKGGPEQMTFSADGRRIAAVVRYYSGQIRILDAATGAILHTTGPVPDSSGVTLRFSPDGKGLACGTADGAVLRWDLPRVAW